MKIAIYGDSPAANVIHRSINDDVSYIEMLYKKYDVTNFGKSGSSLFYSYQQFVDSHKQFDKIIFLATFPGRVYLSTRSSETIDTNYRHISSISHAEAFANIYADSPSNSKIFNAVRDYILYVKNDEQDRVFHNLMLDDIKLKRPDAILIDVTIFSANKDTDFNFWGIKESPQVWINYADIRHCHLSKEKHIILYDMIDDRLHTNKPIDYSKLLNIKPSKSFEEYFISMKEQDIIFISYDEYKEYFK